MELNVMFTVNFSILMRSSFSSLLFCDMDYSAIITGLSLYTFLLFTFSMKKNRKSLKTHRLVFLSKVLGCNFFSLRNYKIMISFLKK